MLLRIKKLHGLGKEFLITRLKKLSKYEHVVLLYLKQNKNKLQGNVKNTATMKHVMVLQNHEKEFATPKTISCWEHIRGADC